MELVMTIIVLVIIVILFAILFIVNDRRMASFEKEYNAKMEEVSKQLNIVNHYEFESDNLQNWNIKNLQSLGVTQEWVNDESVPKWDNLRNKPTNYATKESILSRDTGSWQTSKPDNVQRLKFDTNGGTLFGTKSGYVFQNSIGGQVAAITEKGDMMNAGDLVLTGNNEWIIHTPKDGRKSMYIAPKVNGQWNWGAETKLDNDGKVNVKQLCVGNACVSETDMQFFKSMMDFRPIKSIGGLVGFYTGESWYAPGNMWIDLSGMNNHVTEVRITATISNAGTFTNGKKFISGNVNAGLRFPPSILPGTYTLFYIAKYNGGTRQRIFNGVNQNWLSGFWGGRSGIAHHNNWLTRHDLDYHNNNWVLGTDQNNLYRSNKQSRVGGPGAGFPSFDRISINWGVFSEFSDWAVACVVVYNRALTTGEITQVENELASVYKLGF